MVVEVPDEVPVEVPGRMLYASVCWTTLRAPPRGTSLARMTSLSRLKESEWLERSFCGKENYGFPKIKRMN